MVFHRSGPFLHSGQLAAGDLGYGDAMTQQQDPYQRRPVDIDAYAPPRRNGGPLWFVLAGVVAVGLVLAALLLRSPAPAEAPPRVTTPRASALPGMPFSLPDDPSNSGRWEILGHAWSGDEVTVTVRVSCDEGSISYAFVAFSNAGTETYEPVAGAPDPEIGSGTLTAGGSVEGNLRIPMPAGDATLILTTGLGRQMSALPIPG